MKLFDRSRRCVHLLTSRRPFTTLKFSDNHRRAEFDSGWIQLRDKLHELINRVLSILASLDPLIFCEQFASFGGRFAPLAPQFLSIFGSAFGMFLRRGSERFATAGTAMGDCVKSCAIRTAMHQLL